MRGEWLWAATVAAVVLAGCGDSRSDSSQTAMAASAPQAPTVEAAPAAASDAAPDQTLTGRDAGALYSEFVGNLQAVLFAQGVVSQTLVSRIRQDISFSDLEAYRKDAASFKDSAQSAQDKIQTEAAPQNVSDADAQYFENVRTAANDLMSEDENIAVDIAVNADTGLSDVEDMKASMNKIGRLRKAFERAAMDGYRHFGFRRNEIDAATLTIKAAQ